MKSRFYYAGAACATESIQPFDISKFSYQQWLNLSLDMKLYFDLSYLNYFDWMRGYLDTNDNE